jgi:hypothetical protein
LPSDAPFLTLCSPLATFRRSNSPRERGDWKCRICRLFFGILGE